MTSSYYSSLPESARLRLLLRLDEGHEGVPRDLGKIAETMYEWEGSVAEALGLSPADVESIKVRHSGELKLQTRAALQMWQERNGPAATYHNLIELFTKAGKANYADTVCDILKEPPVAAAVTPALPQPTVDPQPIIVQGKSYGKTEIGVLKKNEAKIKQAFSHLVSQVLTMLMNLPVNMDVFRVYIAFEFPGILERVPSTASVSDYFAYITDKQLWSYSNHSPIQSVAEEYLSDNPRTEELMDEYETKLAGYYATTSIVDYIALCKEEERKTQPGVTLDDAYFQKISLKLEIPFTEETLKYVSDVWKSLAKRFLLPTVTALLYCVVEGSLVITWCVPRHYAAKIRESVTRAEAVEFFRYDDNMISEIKLGEEVLYYDIKMCLLGVCLAGDIQKVMKLIPEVPDFDFSEYWRKPLEAAAKKGDHHLAKKLLESGVEVDGRDEYGYTPLMLASSTDVAQVLLDGGADVNARTNFGYTALIRASRYNHLQVVQLLLKHHPDVNARTKRGFTALIYASRDGYAELVKILLEGGADPNIADNYGYTALIEASSNNRLQVVQLLLKHHPDVNARDKYGVTALIYASRDGYAELVKILLEGGADPNIADNNGDTALILASQYNHLQVVQLLLKHHPDVNARNEYGVTALIYASRDGYAELVKILLEGGADPNIADNNGDTALIKASQYNHLQLVQLLLKHHPDVNARNENGFTALMHASRHGHVEVVKILLEGGADPNIADDEKNWTALFFACNKDDDDDDDEDISDDDRLKMVHLLINHSADVDFRDKSGVSANDVALTHGFQEISDLILSHSRSKQQNTINEETRRRVQTAGDYFRALLDFLLPDKAKKREGLLKEDERMESGVTVKDTGKKKRSLWARLTRRHNAPPTIPT